MTAMTDLWQLARRRGHGGSAADWLRMGLLGVVILAIALAILARTLPGDTSGAQRLIGKPAPAFSLPVAAHGQLQPSDATLAAELGRPVMLVFFYTLCTHCLSQIQTVSAVTAPYAAHDGLRVLYIDAPAEPPAIPAQYLERLSIDAPVLLDRDEATAARYGVRSYPAIFLLDQRGIVRNAWTGETSATTIKSALRQAASSQAAPR